MDENTTDYGWNKETNKTQEYLEEALFEILRKYQISKEAKILDAGCGGGYLLNKLHTQKYKNIWGFDVSSSGVKVATESYLHLKENVVQHNAYEISLPNTFPKNQYDIVLSVEVLEHLFDPQKYLRNIRGWLKKDGLLILTTPYHGYLKNIMISLLGIHDKHYNPLRVGGHIKFFSRFTLTKLFNEESFEILESEGVGRFRYLWKSMIIVAKIHNDN